MIELPINKIDKLISPLVSVDLLDISLHGVVFACFLVKECNEFKIWLIDMQEVKIIGLKLLNKSIMDIFRLSMDNQSISMLCHFKYRNAWECLEKEEYVIRDIMFDSLPNTYRNYIKGYQDLCGMYSDTLTKLYRGLYESDNKFHAADIEVCMKYFDRKVDDYLIAYPYGWSNYSY